jgi:hypothetical protein
MQFTCQGVESRLIPGRESEPTAQQRLLSSQVGPDATRGAENDQAAILEGHFWLGQAQS